MSGDPITPLVQMRACVGCPTRFVAPHPKGWPPGFCTEDCYRDFKRAEAPPAKPHAPLIVRGTTKPRRVAISPASPEQRAKKRAGASIVSGAVEGLDPAHLCPRDLGGCDDPDCVVPLTRAEHRAFDEPDPRTGKRLDLLPYLVANRCIVELQHALEHYNGDLIALLERVTGEKWIPADQSKREGST